MVNRNLMLLLSGQLVSQIGDKFHMLAISFLVLKTTGSPAKMGLVLFCSVFPGMLLGFISGAFLDRYSRKAIIVSADIIRGGIVAVTGLLFYADSLSFPLLLAAQVLISACTAFFDPAIPAIIPQLVEKTELPRANSQAQFISGSYLWQAGFCCCRSAGPLTADIYRQPNPLRFRGSPPSDCGIGLSLIGPAPVSGVR